MKTGTHKPTVSPTKGPTSSPTAAPTASPTATPSLNPAKDPSLSPTANPTPVATSNPTPAPTPSASSVGTYATKHMDLLLEMDKVVGSLVTLIEEKNLAEDTIIIFASDNGGGQGTDPSTGHYSNGPLRGRKGMIYEGKKCLSQRNEKMTS